MSYYLYAVIKFKCKLPRLCERVDCFAIDNFLSLVCSEGFLPPLYEWNRQRPLFMTLRVPSILLSESIISLVSLPFIAINVCYMVLLLLHAIKIVLFAAIYISCYRDLYMLYVITSNVMLYDLREIKYMFCSVP